jgi:hypothetical protein
MSFHGNSGHKGSLTLANSNGRVQDHWHHSWPIADNVQKLALALVSLGFFSNRNLGAYVSVERVFERLIVVSQSHSATN